MEQTSQPRYFEIQISPSLKSRAALSNITATFGYCTCTCEMQLPKLRCHERVKYVSDFEDLVQKENGIYLVKIFM